MSVLFAERESFLVIELFVELGVAISTILCGCVIISGEVASTIIITGESLFSSSGSSSSFVSSLSSGFSSSGILSSTILFNVMFILLFPFFTMNQSLEPV